MTGLILHVGMDKTGTTAIQHGLGRARGVLLAERGVLLPRAGGWHDDSHHGLAFAALGMVGLTHGDLARMFAEMQAEIAGAGAQRVLISSECLFKLPYKDPASPFFAHVARTFDKVRVVVYVRRQDRWVESRHRHSIISGQELTIEQLSRSHFSGYKSFIDLWADRYGAENIALRPFERCQFPGGDVTSDFLAAADIAPIDAACGGTGVENAAFHYKDVLFRAAVNHLDLPGEIGNALNVFLLSRDHADDPDIDLIPAGRARALVERYAGMNGELARRYMDRDDGRLFHEDAAIRGRGRALRTLPAKDASAIFRELEAARPAIAEAIRKRLAEVNLAGDAAPLAEDRLRLLAEAAGVRWAGNPAPAVKKPARDRLVQACRPLMHARRLWPVGAGRIRGGAPEPLFVHFGILKTGSSSIQQTLFSNDGTALGYSYPDLGLANQSLALSNAFVAPEVHPAVCRGGEGDLEGQKARRIHARDLLGQALTGAPRDLPVVLSAETISSFAIPALEDLSAFLAGFGRERIWLGYMREPASYMRSVLQETLKTRLPDLRAFCPEPDPTRLAPQYYRIVDRIDRVAGRGNVRVFAFDRQRFPGGDVVRHFLGEIGADSGKTRVRLENTGLSMTAVKLLYVYRNRLRPRDDGPDANATRPVFFADLAGIGGEPFRFHPDLVARIAAANAAFFDWAAARLDRAMEPSMQASATGLRVIGDLERFAEAEIGICAEWLGRYGIGLPARPGPDDLAQAMDRVRRRDAKRAVA